MPNYAPVPAEIHECLELIIASGEGAFLPNFYGSTLDGSDVAEYLTELGYDVLSYEDKSRYGLVKLANGVNVSTSGYACLRRRFMQTIFRIEHSESGVGFYNHGSVPSTDMAADLFDEMRHPMAWADSKLCRDADAKALSVHELLFDWRYGFESLAQLRTWVYDDSWLEAMHADGFVLREYSCPLDACLIGSTQVMFDEDAATEVAEHSLIDLIQE